MLKIKNENVKWVGYQADYELENGILLFDTDWNGEIYTEGFDPKTEKSNGRRYSPVYKEVDEEQFEIIGFEEN